MADAARKADAAVAALKKQTDAYAAANPPDAHVAAFRAHQEAAKAAGEEDKRLSSQVNQLRQVIDPIGEATKRYNTALLQNVDLLMRGRITATEFAKANDIAARSLQQVKGGAGLAANQLQNLSFQFNDILTGVLSGQLTVHNLGSTRWSGLPSSGRSARN